VTAADFEAYLHAGNRQIVLCFTNVRELVGPLGDGAEFMRMRPLLQSLEHIPNVYLKEVSIVRLEIQAAVDAFTGQTEYVCQSPYVRRWDYTLSEGDPTSERLVNLRLDDIIYLINLSRPDVFAPAEHHLGTLQRVVQEDRALLRAGRLPPRLHFINSIKRHAATNRVNLPPGREDEFAEWVYRNPNRCPGIRLVHEVFRALTANYGDIPETADFSDLAHIYSIPHVDAVTLDRRMRHYCDIASRKLLRFGADHNYRDRIYEDISDLMGRVANP
jgi:hypothetical protein